MISELYVIVPRMKWLMMLEDRSKLSSTAVSEASMQMLIVAKPIDVSVSLIIYT